MTHVLAAILSSAAVFAVLCETPALAGNGNDPRFEANQAQLHPGEANQAPDWKPNDVPVGEPYPAVPGAYAFYGPNGVRPLGMVSTPTALAP
jgi:hypothetical protein